MAPLSCRLIHQVWEIWLYWILSALRGGIWVYSWEVASHVQDLRENIPATERHSLRLLTCHKSKENGNRGQNSLRHVTPQSSLPLCLVNQAWSLGVIHRASNRKRMAKMQSWRTAQTLTRPRSIRRSKRTTNCGKFSRTC